MKRLTILGATGSIGGSTIDVVLRHPERYEIFALTAHSRVGRLLEPIRRTRPRVVVVGSAAAADELAGLLGRDDPQPEIRHGEAALCEVASAAEVDAVMAAIVGAAGLAPTLAAARSGKQVLLANKEALVMSGALFMEAIEAGGASLLPIDSEHNAVFQALPPGFDRRPAASSVRRILLMASGGPFRRLPADSLADITPEQACAHPNWVMGRKISVDSATMMNKGLEVIEAHWLFGAEADAIQVVVHPQSVIHSMVEYADGSVIAQLGNPDMRTPIAHALAHPERIDSGVAALDLFAVARLEFEAPDLERFPCLALAYQALRAGGSAAAVLNAANEVAVEAFLAGRLAFTGISEVCRTVLERIGSDTVRCMQDVFEADRAARRQAAALIPG